MEIKNKLQLKRVLHYGPHTGVFTRIQAAAQGKPALGEIKGVKRDAGEVKLFGVWYSLGHLAWLYVTGEYPDRQVLHLDGDRANFKWANLFLGKGFLEGKGYSISFISEKGLYQAYLHCNVKNIYVGAKKDIEEVKESIRKKAAEISIEINEDALKSESHEDIYKLRQGADHGKNTVPERV